MRAFLLLLTIVCFAVALAFIREWHVFGIEPTWNNTQNAWTWTTVAGACFAASFLPWGTRFRYWFTKGAT